MTPVSLKFSDWPAEDRDFWPGLFRKGHPLDEAGPLSHLRPATVNGTTYSYGCWLAWLARDHPALLSIAPAARLTPEALVDWLESMSHLSKISCGMHLDRVMRVVRSLLPRADLERHRQVQRYLHSLARETTSARKHGRVVETRLLFEAGKAHYQRHASEAATSVKCARACKDAMMIVLLALMPMRRRAYANLELGRSLLRTRDGWRVVLDGSDLKCGQSWESAVHEPAASLLTHYVEVVLPRLRVAGAADAGRLWLTIHGTPYHEAHLGARITLLTSRLIGRAICPHLFRDCAATTLALRSADEARAIRSLLGQTSERTATRHYIQAKSMEAARVLQEGIDELKRRNGMQGSVRATVRSAPPVLPPKTLMKTTPTGGAPAGYWKER